MQERPEDRTIPGNRHVWDDLDQLTAQVHTFRHRVAERRKAFLAGADELQEALDKCDRILTELATTAAGSAAPHRTNGEEPQTEESPYSLRSSSSPG